jgi:hypothetical protein
MGLIVRVGQGESADGTWNVPATLGEGRGCGPLGLLVCGGFADPGRRCAWPGLSSLAPSGRRERDWEVESEVEMAELHAEREKRRSVSRWQGTACSRRVRELERQEARKRA